MDIVVNRSGVPLSKVKCRMLALDLDGTLLNSNHEVSLHNIKILNTVEQQGTLVILVSGRMHQSMLPISQQIGLQNPIISYNGGMVKHPKTGDVSFHLPVPRSLAVRLIEYCQKANLHLNFGWNDQLYVRQRNHWSDLYESRTGVSAEATGDLLELPEAEPTKMQVLADHMDTNPLWITNKNSIANIKAAGGFTNTEYLVFYGTGETTPPTLTLTLDYVAP